MPKYFRRKPLAIQAMRVPPESDFGKDLDDLVEWLNTEGAGQREQKD